jgi:hypothetical protein
MFGKSKQSKSNLKSYQTDKKNMDINLYVFLYYWLLPLKNKTIAYLIESILVGEGDKDRDVSPCLQLGPIKAQSPGCMMISWDLYVWVPTSVSYLLVFHSFCVSFPSVCPTRMCLLHVCVPHLSACFCVLPAHVPYLPLCPTCLCVLPAFVSRLYVCPACMCLCILPTCVSCLLVFCRRVSPV